MRRIRRRIAQRRPGSNLHKELHVVDFKSIDDKTSLAGANRLEILMFRLWDSRHNEKSPLFGINVFKVRELVALPNLTAVPNRHPCVPGIANIRGKAVPVIDLHKYFGCGDENNANIIVVTEFNNSIQGFLAHEIDDIKQFDWGEITEPPSMISEIAGVSNGNVLTAMSVLDGGQMLLIIDVEQIISEVLGTPYDTVESSEISNENAGTKVYFADDSAIARAQIKMILDKMGIEYQYSKSGQEAYDDLQAMADAAEENGEPLINIIQAIITDVEMPVMDGYVLTEKIKKDKRFKDIPILMHSSLSAEENIRLGMKVGVDAYISKMRPKEFSKTLNGLISKSVEKLRALKKSSAA